MFARSSVCVKGGTFFDVQGGYHVHGQKRSGFDFLFESVAQGAFHNSAERFDPPKCHPSTRIVILQKIMDWIKDLDPSSPDIMWLYGPVGAGKSAIAQSIAELCFELGLLIGTFFFSRSIPGRNDDKRLVATIAYHIAISFPEAKPYIEKAIEEDPSLLSRSLETQLKAIIVEPFSKISTNLSSRPETRPRLIVIDGLDECQESRAQSSIIHLFSQLILHHKLPFAILFGSRAEYHIRAAFQDDQFKDSLLSIPLDDTYCPDADIREFLSIRFREIRDNHPLKHCIPDPWPSIEAIEELVQKSSGQFIYASTVIKYVDSHRHRPTDRLNVILGLKSVEDEAPFTELDNLYKHILSSVQDFGLTSRVLGLLLYVELPFPIIGLFKIITSPHFMEEFLSLQKGDVYLALSDLHSVLHAPSDDDYDFGIHASFTDFLADRYRSGRYFLDPVRVQEDLAICCIQHFNAGELVV
ncbi:hypothetical protein BYT27DRAFT_7208025 [Phlegmacium glaucopus]|nr:hypothetical protein BYT27DRAFT_7208025 [Phlegmacium glaucopus]